MDYIKIGHIVSTHGLKGEFKVFLLTENVEEFYKPGNKIYLMLNDNSYQEQEVLSYRVTPKNTILLFIKDIDSISLAEPYEKFNIYAEKKALKNKVFLKDLIGFKVLDENKKEIGKIDDFQVINGKNYLLINDKYLPYIADVFIVSIDEKNKTITISEQAQEVITNA